MPGPTSLIGFGPSTLSRREDTPSPAPVAAGCGFMDRAAYALGIAIQHVTRTGATFGNVSSGADALRLMRFARDGGAILWVGNNGLGVGNTVDQEIAALTTAMDLLIAAGVRRFYLTLGMPRAGSSNDYADSTGQTTTTGYGFGDDPLRLSRAIAALGRIYPGVLILPFPDVRASDDITKWRGASPRMTGDGAHPEAPGHILMASDFVAALDTYADWPTHQANMALSCPAANRPLRAHCDALAEFVTNVEAENVSLFAGPWWGNAPLQDGDGALRRVDGAAPGRWNLFTNPAADSDQTMDYSPYGTGSGTALVGSGYLRPGMLASIHWPADMTNDVGFYVWLPDSADQLQIISSSQTTANNTVAWSNGGWSVRLNNTSPVFFPCRMQTGLLHVQRRGGSIVEAWMNGTYLGAVSQAAGDVTSGGLRFFDHTGAGVPFSRRRFALAGFIRGSLTDAQVQALTAEAAALVAYGNAQNGIPVWHALADPSFDAMTKELGIAPSSDWQTWYNDMIQALDTGGYLSVLDHLSIHHGHDAKVGLLNVIRPRNISTIGGSYDTSSIDFVAKSGSLFSTTPIITDLNPSHGATDIGYGRGLHLERNNNSLIVRCEINGQSDNAMVGAHEFAIAPSRATVANQIGVRPSWGAFVGAVPTGAPLSGAHTTSFDRDNSATVGVYSDGSQQGSAIARTTQAFGNFGFYIGRRSGNDSPSMDTTQRLRWVLAGASVGSAGQAAIHAILAAADAAMPEDEE